MKIKTYSYTVTFTDGCGALHIPMQAATESRAYKKLQSFLATMPFYDKIDTIKGGLVTPR